MVMTDKVFNRLGKFIHENYGIKMPVSKKIMLQTRLQKRLRLLNMPTFDQYCDFVLAGAKDEVVEMIDLVSTNKTDFFREPSHFDYLVNQALPTLFREHHSVARKIRLWSAGCSSGEEPYTLAMVLSDFVARTPGCQFSILATDISTRVLDMARKAIYDEDKVAPVPAAMKTKYLMRSKDPSQGVVRIVPELRSLITFERLNFMDETYAINQPLDIIFCRNVIIYFDVPTQERLLNKFCRHLKPGGFVFMGHSETLNGIKSPLVQVAPTIYRTLK
jgi:chemotaxis protein methyltransferase CheR